MQALIQQSFDIFNVYGKEPEAAKNILHGFVMVLEEHEIADITAAFRQWMRESSTMPTPADILRLAVTARGRRLAAPAPGEPWGRIPDNRGPTRDDLSPEEHAAAVERIGEILRGTIKKID